MKSNIGQSSDEKLNVKGKRWTWVENLRREIHLKPRWQKLCEGTKGLRRKVWNQTKILSPNILYFFAILRFVAIHELFGRLWPRKGLYRSKTVQCFLGRKCTITWTMPWVLELYVKLRKTLCLDFRFFSHTKILSSIK